jgi:pimeloyl-ACP methyl ester carboxylesterase
MAKLSNSMANLRTHGSAPFNIAVLHGGPGAAGEMAPVARELASSQGILEPLQTAASLDGQIEELGTVLGKNGDPPVTLIGFSWGAWLGFVFAANNSELVRKLILVGSGPFEEGYVAKIGETRLSRLSAEERAEVQSLGAIIDSPEAGNKDAAFERLGTLLSKADAYDPIPHESTEIDYDVGIFQKVWKDAAELRSSGRLLELGRHIECPVVVIHGDYDSHPAEGVQKPLSAILKSFRFVLLKNCGHMPWIERHARDKFYQILEEELP